MAGQQPGGQAVSLPRGQQAQTRAEHERPRQRLQDRQAVLAADAERRHRSVTLESLGALLLLLLLKAASTTVAFLVVILCSRSGSAVASSAGMVVGVGGGG